MIIESGLYNNTRFVWSVFPYKPNMMISIKFYSKVEELSKLDDNTIRNIIGIEGDIKPDTEAENGFIWKRYIYPNDKDINGNSYIIEWNFPFESVSNAESVQKWQFVREILNAIDKINDCVKENKNVD